MRKCVTFEVKNGFDIMKLLSMKGRKTMNKKKIITACLVVALLAVFAIGGSLAYFTDTEEKDNTFTVGNVDIQLTEPNWVSAGSVDAPEVYPGEPLAKDPTVTNNGANPCFVRIQVTGLDCLGNAGMITYRTDYVDNKLGDNWVKGNDGYYYYNKVLEVGTTTDALFDQIVIPTGVTNDDAFASDSDSDTVERIEYSVNVKAEAVQAQGARASWSAVQKMSVDEIAAWFTTCMPSSAE